MNNKDFKRIVRLSPLADSKIYHLIRFYLKKRQIPQVLKKSGHRSGSLKETSKLMREAMVHYRWDFDEFIMYHYETITSKERELIVPEYEKNIFCDEVNDYKKTGVFDSKWKSYCRFNNFYGRDCACFSENENDNSLSQFLEKHTSFILKPDSAACGRGITIIRTNDKKEAISRIRESVRDKKGVFVVEELIQSSRELEKLHPASVNTVRIPTIRFDDRIEVIHPFLRIGRGSAIVDNAGSGGIMGNIDIETGRVYTASDEFGNVYDVHPDTGVQLIGFEIPRWKEAIELTKVLAQVVPEVRYVGWDLALTNDGWVMIEGNDRGQFVFQGPDQKGFREEFEKIRGELLS